MQFTAFTVTRALGVTLGVVFLAHYAPMPWWIIGGAALALLFLP
jgi:hypothetical protein